MYWKYEFRIERLRVVEVITTRPETLGHAWRAVASKHGVDVEDVQVQMLDSPNTGEMSPKPDTGVLTRCVGGTFVLNGGRCH